MSTPHELWTVVLKGVALARYRPAEPPQHPPHLANGARALSRQVGGARLFPVSAGWEGCVSLQGSHCGIADRCIIPRKMPSI